MKTFVRILSLTLVAVMLCATLASCGGVPSGEYYFGDKEYTKTYTQYVFKGSKVTVDVFVAGTKANAESFEGKYKVKDGKITFTWKDADGNEKTATQDFDHQPCGAFVQPIDRMK